MRSGPFDAADGTKLHGEWFPAAGTPRAGVLIVHGYADHGGRFGHVAKRLQGDGFSVLTFDYRGHGKAEGKRGHCAAFGEYLTDLHSAVAQLREGVGERPIAIVAHSHGALITLRALSEPGRTPPGVAAVALSSPYLGLAMKVPAGKILAGRVMSRIWPSLALGNGIQSKDLTHDAQMIAAHDADPLVHKVATARWFTEATAAQEYVGAHADRVAVPTLWLVAGEDHLADPAVAKQVHAKAGGEKKLHVYDKLFHELFNEVERERVLDDLTAWLSPRFPVP
jgi:lysophospholipase